MLAYLFVAVAAAVRFLPHPWHFTPVTASLLFFGAHRSRSQFWFPFLLLAASDVVLTKLIYVYPFTWDHLVSWAWYAAVLALGTRLGSRAKPVWIMASALASSVLFYLASNFAVWAVWNMYPKTVAGLMASYTLALPFFERAVTGDLLYTALFFALPVALRHVSRAVRASRGPAAA
jgi:hypothetical protein